jgi:hypothetical protein
MDKWVLGRLSDCLKEVQEAYETYQVCVCVLAVAILVLLCYLSQTHWVCCLAVTVACTLRYIVLLQYDSGIRIVLLSGAGGTAYCRCACVCLCAHLQSCSALQLL